MLSRNVGFIFNGSGFYITDYVRKSSQQTSSESSGGSSSTATSTE